MEYLGEQSKPYYKIFLYTHISSIDTSKKNHFFTFFKVTKGEFKNIRSAIELSNLEGTTFINEGIYSFTIIYKGNVKKFTTGYIEPIKAIFTKISIAVDNVGVKKELEAIFNQTLLRLGSKLLI